MEITTNAIFNDISFWIELFISIVTLFLSFIIKGIRKDIERLFIKTDQHGEDISSLKTDIKNLRGEFERSVK